MLKVGALGTRVAERGVKCAVPILLRSRTSQQLADGHRVIGAVGRAEGRGVNGSENPIRIVRPILVLHAFTYYIHTRTHPP